MPMEAGAVEPKILRGKPVGERKVVGGRERTPIGQKTDIRRDERTTDDALMKEIGKDCPVENPCNFVEDGAEVVSHRSRA